MKTLDEVIEYFNNQCKMRHVYLTEDADARFAEALHYLKEYRETVTNCNQLDDEPLTFDEVREMLGKPVWMEWNMAKGWRLVNCFDSVTTGEKAVALTDRYGVDFVFNADSFAKCEVMVYRKERE